MYDVTLEVNDGITTSTLTMEDYIMVGTLPVADFMADQTSILSGQSIDFTNLSTGDDLTYSWYFEGGTPEMSSDEMPTGIVYNEVGLFDVELIITNEFGADTMLMVEYIEVRPVGIDQNAEAGMAIYPNPAQNNLTIQMDNSSNYSIQLLRMDGQMVIEQHASDKISQLDVSKLSSGIYIIQVKSLSTAEIFTKKILIQ
jgi:PKD repeat protein